MGSVLEWEDDGLLEARLERGVQERLLKKI